MLHLFFNFGPSLLIYCLFCSFHGAIFLSCFSSHCAIFTLHSSLSHSFHVAPFPCSTFLELHSFYNTLSHGSLPCCIHMMLHFFIFFHVAHFHFYNIFFHVILYQVTVLTKYLQIQFCFEYKTHVFKISGYNIYIYIYIYIYI